MKRALVLCHEPDGPAAQVEVRLVERGWQVDTHLVTADPDKPNDAAVFPELDGYDLLAPMGSMRSLTRKHEIDTWIDDELAMVRSAHDSGMPILGVCFGGQIIAEALGGTVESAPVIETGWVEISDGPDGPNPVGPGPWFEWHHDRFTAPPGADVLAVSDNAVQLIRIEKTVGTQFHPEIDQAHLQGWLSNAPADYLAELGMDRDEMTAEMAEREAANAAQCHRLVDWFLDEVAFPS